MSRILITTDYLKPGDRSTRTSRHGLTTRHDPRRGRAITTQLIADCSPASTAR